MTSDNLLEEVGSKEKYTERKNIDENVNKSGSSKPKGNLLAIKILMPFIAQQKLTIAISVIAIVFSTMITVSLGQGVRILIDSAPSQSNELLQFLDQALIVALVLTLLYATSKYIGNYCAQVSSARVTQNIRSKVYEKIINQDIEYIEAQTSGDMQTRIIADTDKIEGFVSTQIPSLVSGMLALVGGVAGALYISAKLTLVILAISPIVLLPMFALGGRLRARGKSMQAAVSDMGTFAGETFRNIKILQAYGNEGRDAERFSHLAQETAKHKIRSARLESILVNLINGAICAGLAFLLWISAKDIVDGDLTIGELVAFGYYAVLIIQAVIVFVGFLTAVNIAIGTMHKVTEYLNLEKQSAPGTTIIDEPLGAIEFKDIHFNYPHRPEAPVLNGIDIKIQPGSQVAIVGPSGAGKSTVMDLLLKFYTPTQGVISIGGIDIKNMATRELRQQTGFVPQKESLVSGTVFDNIRFGFNTDDDSVKEAAIKAHAHEFIEKLPQGYNTDIGEIGGRLSGGQKQRIALARALLRNPKVLLLDEPNSALDTESERHVMKALRQLSTEHDKTILTIAHRLSTVRDADFIVVIDKGRVVSQGTHEELCDTCDVYQKLSFSDAAV